MQVAQTINDIHQLSKLSQLNNISGMLLHLCMWNQERGPHELLVRFINCYSRLQAGVVLFFPLLFIKFYQWIHTDLLFIITKKQANEMSQMTVYDPVDLAAKKF